MMFTIIWDNDGVLVDTEGLYFQGDEDCPRNGWKQPDVRAVQGNLPPGRKHFAAGAGQFHGPTE
jgi:phosphoglycolate phosphatase-like HAD superfamily hydrolase